MYFMRFTTEEHMMLLCSVDSPETLSHCSEVKRMYVYWNGDERGISIKERNIKRIRQTDVFFLVHIATNLKY